MAGFKNNVRSSVYFTILGGEFVQPVDASVEGAVARENKNGKIVHELHHAQFEGILVSVGTREGQYGKQWEFVFDVDGERYTLQLPYSNSYVTALLKMLPNVDVSKPFEMTPSQKVVDGKIQSSLFVKQNGQNIKHAFTKDQPNGLPPMEQKMVKGQQVWDDTNRLAFLEEMVRKDIVPKLSTGFTESKNVSQGDNISEEEQKEVLASEDNLNPGDNDF